MLRLGKLGPTAGADSGCLGPVVALLGRVVLMGATFGDLCALSHLQLKSVFSEAAVDGALSPFSCSEAAESTVVALLLEVVEPCVDVRFSGVLPVRGGELSVIERRKSR